MKKVLRASREFLDKTMRCLKRRKDAENKNNARRQKTWFRNQTNLEVLSLSEEKLESFFNPSTTDAIIQSQQMLNGYFWPYDFPNNKPPKTFPKLLTLDSSYLKRLGKKELENLSKRHFSLSCDFGLFNIKEVIDVPYLWKKLSVLSFSGKDLCNLTSEKIFFIQSCYHLQKLVFNLEVDADAFLESTLVTQDQKVKETEKTIVQNTKLIIEKLPVFFKERILSFEMYADDLTQVHEELLPLVLNFPYLKELKWHISKKVSEKILAPSKLFETLADLRHLEKISFSFEEIGSRPSDMRDENTDKLEEKILEAEYYLQKEKEFFDLLKEKVSLQEIDLPQYLLKSTSEKNVIGMIGEEFISLKKLRIYLSDMTQVLMFKKLPLSLEVLEFNFVPSLAITEVKDSPIELFLNQLTTQCPHLKAFPSFITISDNNPYLPKERFSEFLNILSRSKKIEDFSVELSYAENFIPLAKLISQYAELKNFSFSFVLEEKIWDALDTENPDKKLTFTQEASNNIHKNLKFLLQTVKNKFDLESLHLKLDFFDESILRLLQDFVTHLSINDLTIDLDTPGIFQSLQKENPDLYKEIQTLEKKLKNQKICNTRLHVLQKVYYTHSDAIEEALMTE